MSELKDFKNVQIYFLGTFLLTTSGTLSCGQNSHVHVIKCKQIPVLPPHPAVTAHFENRGINGKRKSEGRTDISNFNPFTTEPQAIFLLLENVNLGIIN